VLEDEKSWQQGQGPQEQERMMAMVKEAARIKAQVAWKWMMETVVSVLHAPHTHVD
jgi:hypothetical protein